MALPAVAASGDGTDGSASDGRHRTLVDGELIWSESDGQRFEIHVSSLTDGIWSDPRQLTDDNADNLHPSIDVGPEGKKWAVWTAVEPQGMQIRYSFSNDGTWRDPETLTTGLASNIKPSVLVGEDGVPFVVWTGNRGGSDLDDIYYSRFVQQEWTEPRTVHQHNAVPDILPTLERNKDGKPVVSWRRFHGDGYVAMRSDWDGKNWTEPVEVIDDERQGGAGQSSDNIIELPDFVNDTRQAFFRMHIRRGGTNKSSDSGA